MCQVILNLMPMLKFKITWHIAPLPQPQPPCPSPLASAPASAPPGCEHQLVLQLQHQDDTQQEVRHSCKGQACVDECSTNTADKPAHTTQSIMLTHVAQSVHRQACVGGCSNMPAQQSTSVKDRQSSCGQPGTWLPIPLHPDTLIPLHQDTNALWGCRQ